MKSMFLLSLILLVNSISQAQSEQTNGLDIKVKSVILLDENDINVSGIKVENLMLTFTRHLRIKINNLEDTQALCRIVLPDLLDPSLKFQSPAERNASFCYDKIKINGFSADIITTAGEKKPCKVSIDNQEIQMASYWDDRYKKYYASSYRIHGVGKGDEVDIRYEYCVPYSENYMRLTSFRIFFHGNYTKEQYSLAMHYSKNLKVYFKYENEAKPDSTREEGGIKTLRWYKKELHGCFNEPGSLPYFTLPNVIFNLQPMGLMYRVPYTFTDRYFPEYALAAYYREQRSIVVIKAITQGTNNSQYQKLRTWVADRSAEAKPDTTYFNQLSQVHSAIVDDFAYDKDLPYYKFEDEYDECMGDNLMNKNFRSISRFRIYSALIYSLKLNYFSAYVADKRCGVISDDYVQPMFENDFMFAIPLKDGSMHYLCPKSRRSGYYLNEMPFYYENTKTQLVLINDFANSKQPINEQTRFTRTPGSEVKDNSRKSNILVTIDLDSLNADFSAKIVLAGQYSTMCRSSYLFNETDPTVNPLYGARIWEINNNVKPVTSSAKVLSREFPYKTEISASYRVPRIITLSDGTYQVDLRHWFNFITYSNFSSSGRILPFFPDFKGSDVFTYLLRFNRPVSLAEYPKDVYIHNSFGEVQINISQTQNNEIRIIGKFITLADWIEADKTVEVEKIYQALEALNQSKITVR